MRQKCDYRTLLAGVLFLFCASAVAQRKDSIRTQYLAPVEVKTKAMPSISRATAPLQRITHEEINQLGIQSLPDAVRRFAGVSVKDYGGIGGLKTVSIRGFGAQHTAVTYDGVAVSDVQSGQVDIGRFSLENISTVSIAIGQSDDIFQPARSFASVGILSIETQTPTFEGKKQAGTVQTRTGSFGLFAPFLYFTQQLTPVFTYSANGEWQRADGNYPFDFNNGAEIERRKRLNSDVDILRGELNLYGSFGKGGDLRVKGNYFHSDRGLPGSAISYNIEADDRLKDKDLFVQASYKNELGKCFSIKGNAKFTRSYSFYKDYGNYIDGYVDNIYTQREYYASATLLYKPIRHLHFSLGQDLSSNDLKINYSGQDPGRTTSLSALRMKYETDRLIFITGLLATFAHESVKTGEKPDDKKKLSPAVSLSWRPIPAANWHLRGNYKNIYRLPTFNDLYYFRIGNTELRPENAQQYNIGTTWIGKLSDAIDWVDVSADVYYNKVEDKIAAISPTLFMWKMMNVGSVDIKGVDINVGMSVLLGKCLSLRVNGSYSYQSAIDLTNPEAKNYKAQIPYTPKHSGNGAVSLLTPWINLSYSVVASGVRYSFLENIRRNRLDPYWDHTVSVNRTFAFSESSALRLQADFLNLANENYEIIQSYPMPGHSFRVSAAWTF